ncbi:MAG: flagellar hook capping FlgD N-terminal domain-containing protein [Phycisphaerales bacterium]
MSAISDFSSSNPVSSDDALSTLSSGQFLQIIFTELQNQDPLEPQDTGAMLDQLSTLRTIESDTQMVESLENLVSQNEFAAASQLIGSLVSGVTLDNQRTADLVISVSQTSQGPVLNLFDGSRMFFDQVDEIAGPIDDFANPDTDVDGDDGDGSPPIGDGDGSGEIAPALSVVGDIDMVDLLNDTTDDSPSDRPVVPSVSPGG